jgi:signal transduction histidine kinase
MSSPVTQTYTPAEQVRRTLFRIVAALRVAVLVYAVVVNLGRADEFARPVLAAGALGAMGVWTVVADLTYELRRHRPSWFFVLDVAVACGFLLLTLATHSQELQEQGASSLPTLWVAGAVLAMAVGLGWWQGLVAAVCIAVVDVSVRVETSPNTWANIFLLMLAGAAVGAMSSALCRSAEARAAAERMQATLEERARLARVVHDGVLQVLAMVQRRAQDVDDLGDLARLAAEQEASLRALVQYDARTAATSSAAAPSAPSEGDLVHALEHVTGGHSLSGPGGSVVLPAPVVAEVTAAVSECLLNVTRHVGEQARAWVLVEDLDDEVVVTVRDEGPGIAADRLTTAVAEGRMGVSGSIRGRLKELGGRAELTTGPTIGTEWELHVPRTTTGERGQA